MFYFLGTILGTKLEVLFVMQRLIIYFRVHFEWYEIIWLWFLWSFICLIALLQCERIQYICTMSVVEVLLWLFQVNMFFVFSNFLQIFWKIWNNTFLLCTGFFPVRHSHTKLTQLLDSEPRNLELNPNFYYITGVPLSKEHKSWALVSVISWSSHRYVHS